MTSSWFDSKNADQIAAWNGAEGERWTERAAWYDRACSRFDRWLEGAAAIAADETILDVGCGCGVSTRAAARAASRGTVVGVDVSEPMLARARACAAEEQLSNVRFEKGDVQVMSLPEGSFDLAISRFGCMFFGDPSAAFHNVARALRPAGRLALLTWRALADNDWVRLVRGALAAGRSLPERPAGTPGPFGMADAAAVTDLLTSAGFEEVTLTPIDEPLILGRAPDDACDAVSSMGMAQALLDGLDEATRTRALGALASVLAAAATPEGVLLGGGAWLVAARRRISLAPERVNGT